MKRSSSTGNLVSDVWDSKAGVVLEMDKESKARSRKQTDRMAEYMKNESVKREKKLLSIYELWKTEVRECRTVLKGECNITKLGQSADNLSAHEKSVLLSFESLKYTCTPDPVIVRKVDACLSITDNVVKLINEKIADLDDFHFEGLKELRKLDKTQSIFGDSESVSISGDKHGVADDVGSDVPNVFTHIDKLREVAASDTVASHARQKSFEFQQREQKGSLDQRDVEVDRAEFNDFADLKREDGTEYNYFDRNLEQTSHGIPKVTSKLMPLSNMKPITSSNLHQYVNAAVFNPSSTRPKVHTSVYTENPPRPREVNSVTNVGINTIPSNSILQDSTFARTLADSINLNRLPVPEPSIFTGDPIGYIEWKTSFDVLIDCKSIPQQEKLFYLKKYLGGPARKALEGFFYSGSVSAYNNARKVLDERYGHPFILMKAFKEKLGMWPKIPTKDPVTFRDYADFLQGCRDAIPYIPSLSILNDCSENQKLLSKLPDWAAVRWNREVAQSLENHGTYPAFSQFVNFVQKEANIVCNPVSSLYALNEQRNPREFKRRNQRANVLASNLRVNSPEPVTNNIVRVCYYCDKDDHFIFKCPEFTRLTIERKRSIVLEKKLCFGCLRKGHRNSECKRKHTCITCKGPHPTCLHESAPVIRNRQDNAQIETRKASSLQVNGNCSQSTSMIVPVWISTQNDPSREILTYALLDTQSDTTFILDEIATSLQAQSEHVRLSLSTMTSTNSVIDSTRICDLRVRNFKSNEAVSINCAYTRNFIPVDRSHIPVRETVSNWTHLKSLASELPPLQSCEVGLLIGYNCPQALAPRRTMMGNNNEPYAVQTVLGWSVIGFSSNCADNFNSTSICHRTAVKELPPCSPKDIIKVLESDFAHDKCDDTKVSQQDVQFLDFLNGNIHQRDDKHLEMPLPFKERPVLPDNKQLAILRLNHLKRKLNGNSKYHSHYKAFMKEIIDRGDAEKVESREVEGIKWYIPHHGVYHPRKPDKIRVVFDCSASYKGHSLNQHLLSGPDLTNKLAGVLLRFRRYPIAIMCDVEKMFHQFIVSPADRDFLRFLWWEHGNTSTEPVEYRMRVHLFGAASSPGCANYGLKHLAKIQEQSFPRASAFVRQDFYVDDGLTSVETEEEAIQLIKDAQELCSNGGLHLHKFVSNNKKVTNSIPLSERAQLENKCDSDITFEQMSLRQVLGVQWDIYNDVFNFKVDIQNTSPTRRNMLSTVASIFDPLGFLSPLTFIGKRILQEMCRTGVSWDEMLPAGKSSAWDGWIQEINKINQIQIPRCLIPSTGNTELELHHFSDASSSGYGQCSYLRLVSDFQIHCTLVMGKSRVAPLKSVTIPRLELTAAVLSVKVSSFLKQEMDLPIQMELFWTDSKVVLGYINNEVRRFHVFVANRVQRIRDVTEPWQWHYIDSSNNPADHASRGLSVAELTSSSWLTGPSFLWQREIETKPVDTELQIGDPEVKTVSSFCSRTKVSEFSILDSLKRFSCWSKTVAVVARLIRLSEGIKGIYSPTVAERQGAERKIIQLVQQESFQESIDKIKTKVTLPKTNKLFQLNPFLEDNILRVGGRLRKEKSQSTHKYPVVLPRNGHITQLIIAHAHSEVKHQGRGFTLNYLHDLGYWILGASKVVAKFIHRCVICRKLRRPTEIQKMADLPEDRIESTPPFTVCGMDCFGPFTTKNGRKEVKRYGLLFTCMCSRAVHIEMLDDMTTDAFINGLRCFIAIRGAVRQIRCDNGSNFIGAKNEFDKLVDEDAVNTFLTRKQCEFIFNAPDSSHTGGVWERQIRTIRSILNSVLLMCPGRLDDSSLRTVFYEVMSIVNCRPLTVNNINDPNSLEPLTPNHILTCKSVLPHPPPGKFVKEDLFLRKRWRRVQYILQQFWSRWRKEYISEIALRQKWHSVRRNVCEGDIVLVKDSCLPRNQWPLAVVVEANPDDDNLVRRVKVKMANSGRSQQSVFERSIHKLVLLIEA